MEKRARALIGKIEKSYQQILGDNLVGIYIHGSIAFDCFQWETSDIDFLVVTKNAPSLFEKQALITVLLADKEQFPAKGIEMSLVLEKDCWDFIYPTPYELHFSNAYKQECEDYLEKFCETMHGVDKDLAAHFMVLQTVGIVACGKEIDAVFGSIDKAYYIDSIKSDIENALEDIKDNPVYIVLNLCRVLAYLKEKQILSKKQGGAWGIKKLPKKYKSIIQDALDGYSGSKLNALKPHANLSQEFAKYMIQQIFQIDS